MSAVGDDFNHDFGVSFTKDEIASKAKLYNFGHNTFGGEDAPGISVFAKDGADIYRTYSTYARGVDGIWGAYPWLDRAPKGRNETGVWWRRHDEYGK